MKYMLYLTVIACLFVSCKEEIVPEQKLIEDFEGIDPAIKPGDNFFEHVNKKWNDNVEIADDQVGVGSYMFLNIPQKIKLQEILEKVSIGDNEKGSIEQKVGDFYASGMDTTVINKRGFEPILSILKRIDAINDVASMMTLVGDQMKTSNYSIIYLSVHPDQDNSNINMAHFSQSGLGLPDRDYYFKTDSSTLGIQKAYQHYLGTLFQLTGDKDAEKNAGIVYQIEKQLADSHKTRVERRAVKANFNKLSLIDIDEKQTNIAWVNLLQNLDLKADSVDIKQPLYYNKLNKMLESVSISDWKTYLKANTLRNYANYLSQTFQNAAFEYSKVLTGQSVQKPRAQLMAQNVDRQLGYALAQLYVDKYFKEDAKKRALELVNNLQKAFEIRINELDWMSDSTKLKALDKLVAITKKIGYPDVWRDYSNVSIEKGKYFENVIALKQYAYQYKTEKLNKAPNKDEWGTTPPTVTAYYNPSMNEIVFPAGILQFPYFDLYADDAVNYGGIGMVIGHELTHAFDDQGAQYDKDGNVKNWWTAEDYKKFKAKTQQVIDLYSTFTVLDSVPIKGELTVGENTADIGGISIAYDAFKMTEQGQDTIRINGYSPDERFFLSIARIWRVKTRDAFLRNYVKTNSHSPAMWRVNGPLMNITQFYETFSVQPSDKNFKPESERIKIW